MIDPDKVPFYGNTPDGKHCFQAAMKMILGYFLPSREFSWKELDDLSAKREGLGTWAQRMLINLRQMGFIVVRVGGFDGRAFIRDGAKYIKQAYDNPEAAAWQIKHSDIPQEQQTYQDAYDEGVDIQVRVPELSEIQAYQEQNFLVYTLLNSRSLHNKSGYAGHFVVILSIDKHEVVLHDPGLPPQPALHVPIQQFISAWSYPNKANRNFTAIKSEG